MAIEPWLLTWAPQGFFGGVRRPACGLSQLNKNLCVIGVLFVALFLIKAKRGWGVPMV